MIAFDFEVFKFDWMMVALDLVKREEKIIVNDTKKLEAFYNENKNNLWLGYNCRNYDVYILKGILLGFNPKHINDFIIEQGRKGWEFSKRFREIPLTFFDIIPNPPVGLKTLEGFMGSDIRETTVPFDIDRKLNNNEIMEVIKYCRHDVEQTIEVLNQRMEELNSQLELVKMFDLPKTCLGMTKPQLSARALMAKRGEERKDEFNFTIPNNLKIEKYREVVDWFVSCREKALGQLQDGVAWDDVYKEFYEQKLEIDVAGVPHIFAWGGIHGAKPCYSEKGYFVNVDVASYYPSMMIEYGYISRNISDPEHYKDIYHKRLAYKKAKDKRANPLKIVLNGTYGAMKDRYNPLYDPLQANNVCVTGQLLLLDLVEQLEPHFEIVQSNTDGILVKLRAENDEEANNEYARLDDICHEWDQRTKMVLEFDEFKKVVQRDVNNYLIVDKDGKYKSKGGVVKKLSPLDYDLPIVNKAVVECLVKGIPCEQTVMECDSLKEFQKIVKISRLYNHGLHNGLRLHEKTFRVFASNRSEDGAIYKVKSEGSNPEKFANTPEKCFIWNDTVNGVKCPNDLDKSWYVALAEKRVREFLGVDE